MADNKPIFDSIVGLSKSQDPKPAEPKIKRTIDHKILSLASSGLEFVNNAFWFALSVPVFGLGKAVFLVGAGIKWAGSQALGSFFQTSGSGEKKFIPVSVGVSWAANQLGEELGWAKRFYDENTVTIKEFESEKGEKVPDFKGGTAGRAFSIPQKIVEKSMLQRLQNHELVLGVVAAQRSEDIRFFKTLHRFLNWQDCLNVVSNISYQNEGYSKKYLKKSASTASKLVKQTFFTTEAYLNRDINDAYDHLPLIFNSRKSFNAYNFARGIKFLHGSFSGSNNRGEIATALIYGDAVKDATASYKADSLWHIWSSEKLKDAMAYALIRLDEQVKLYDEYKNSPNGIEDCDVKSKVASHISGYDPKTGEPIIEYFTYGQLYKHSGGFSQETALKVVQHEVQIEMEQNSQMRRFTGGNDAYLFDTLLSPMINYINEVNKINPKINGRQTNFTGQRFFDAEIAKLEGPALPKTQRVWSPQEQSYVLSLMGEMVHGHVPQGVDNFIDANKHLVSTDPQTVDANQPLQEKRISTSLIHALNANLRPEKTTEDIEGLTPGMHRAKLEGERLIANIIKEEFGYEGRDARSGHYAGTKENIRYLNVVLPTEGAKDPERGIKIIANIGRFISKAIYYGAVVAGTYFGGKSAYQKIFGSGVKYVPEIHAPIKAPIEKDSIMINTDTLRSEPSKSNKEIGQVQEQQPKTDFLQQGNMSTVKVTSNQLNV
jgi:hypothetical protein